MNRPAPRISPRQVVAKAVLDPNGGHRLELWADGNIVAMTLDRDQVRQIAGVIEEFDRHVAVADGGPDFHNRRTVPLMGRGLR